MVLPLLLLLPIWLAWPSTAWGQYVTSTGVRCDGQEISFDTLNLPTEGANAARYKELAKLQAYAGEAWAACESRGDRLPGCAYLEEWIAERRKPGDLGGTPTESWEKSSHARRTRLRALDSQVIPQAMRVLAHNACEKAGDKLPPSCVALVAAEASALGMKVCGRSDNSTDVDKAVGLVDPKAARSAAKLQQIKRAKESCDKDPSKCAAERPKINLYEQASDVVDARAYYLAPEPTYAGCPNKEKPARDMTVDIERAVTDMSFDQPQAKPLTPEYPTPPVTLVPPLPPVFFAPLPLPLTGVLLVVAHDYPYAELLWQIGAYEQEKKAYEAALKDHKGDARAQFRAAYSSFWAKWHVHAALVSEIEALNKASESCKEATYYVSPTGALVENRTFSASDHSICIDSASFAIDQSFEVVLSAYPSADRLPAPSRVPAMPIPVWPGESTPLAFDRILDDFHPAIVRVTVRGYPRGVSLRALAQRGASGAAFESSYETADLRVEARRVAEAKAPLDSELAKTAALDALASALAIALDKKDGEPQASITAMNKAVDDASANANDSAKKQEAYKAVAKARGAIGSYLDDYAQRAGKQAVNDAIVDAKALLPKSPGANDDLSQLKAAQTKVRDYLSALQALVSKQRDEQKSRRDRQDALDKKLSRLCRLAKQLLPVVDEDVLIAETTDGDTKGKGRPGAYVIDYDYDAGFQRAPARQLEATDRVYVRVRRVRPGQAVALSINDKGVVQHAVSLVGHETATRKDTEKADDVFRTGGGIRSSFDELKPDQLEVLAGSTQILALPGLDGARRYEIALCAIRDKNEVCKTTTGTEPGSTTARIIARNTLVVHAKRHLGVRAGLGVMTAFGPVRSLGEVSNGTTLKYVREAQVTPDVAVPVLLTVYPHGRDAVDMPKGFSWGVGVGPDMVATFKGSPRVYLGLALDWYGFGLTVGPLVEARKTVNAPAGSYVSTAAEVNRWYGGGFFAITTDFDIFEAALRNYITPSGSPNVGNGGGN
ncbi:Hypothetical protein A7982_01764 [Minicystis rosea]|nr:Hypothetical protein A7982_01764 [Minicystis rosea]